MTDQSDAFIEGASITAKEPAAGRSRRDTSDSNGTYVLPLLPVGTYSLSCTHPGFTTQTQANINITVNQKATVDFVDSLDGEALRSELHRGTLFSATCQEIKP